MRYRITIRGDGAELRGYITAPTIEALGLAAEAVKPIGVMVASPATNVYNPFREEEQRELHHFETEQILAKVRGVIDAEVGWETPALLKETIRRALDNEF